jgi:hypothetical protein
MGANSFCDQRMIYNKQNVRKKSVVVNIFSGALDFYLMEPAIFAFLPGKLQLGCESVHRRRHCRIMLPVA